MVKVFVICAALIGLGGCYMTPQQREALLLMDRWSYQDQVLDSLNSTPPPGVPVTTTCQTFGYGGGMTSCTTW